MKIIITEEQLNTALNEMAYPDSFNMDTFKSIPSFKKRIEYCRQNLTKIGEGSSRMVFKIDDEKVLKLAKNSKGLAQNKKEADTGYNENYFSCIAKVFDYVDDYKFIESEYARKCSKNEFKRITGYDFHTHVKFIYAEANDTLNLNFSQEFIDEAYDEGAIMIEVIDFAKNWKLTIQDLNDLRQYGIVKRNGEEYVVIADYGLDNDIYKKHY